MHREIERFLASPSDSCVLLLSGGMDSGVLLSLAVKKYQKVYALGFNYGSKHNLKELTMARKLAEHYGVDFRILNLPLDFLRSALLQADTAVPDGAYDSPTMKQTVVPFRNGIMLSIATAFADNYDVKDVLIAAHAGDHPIYPDCREAFITAMRHATMKGTYTAVRILAPFVFLTKEQIAEAGREVNFDFTMTWSCYKDLDLHCGVCGTCDERKLALGFGKGLDPTVYADVAGNSK
jgi:7-cyano-7-deazaguanine synthase